MKINIKELVKDPEWQRLRESFVGTWKHTPIQNVLRLRTYLGDFSDPKKVRIILNYLTGSAFRMRRVEHPAIDELLGEVRKRHRGCV